VMKAASENLVPVTLELGGKSPTIVAKGSVKDRAIWDQQLFESVNVRSFDCLAEGPSNSRAWHDFHHESSSTERCRTEAIALPSECAT